MGYGGGIYDHYGMHEKMKEMEERENELEERERRLEERERRHEMEDREYRRMGYESYPTDYYGDDRYYGDGPQMRNTVMDSALHELKDRIDKDPKYKDVKNWLESLPKI